MIKLLREESSVLTDPGISILTPTLFLSVWVTLPLFRWFDSEKYLSPGKAWKSLCVFRLPFLEKALLHCSHINCFSPVWTSMCSFNRLDQKNALLHWVQANRFSPVCTSICSFKLYDREKAWPHSMQANGLSSWWHSLCESRWPGWEKDLSHWMQKHFFLSVWESLCLFIWMIIVPEWEKALPQWMQEKVLSPALDSWLFWGLSDWEKCFSLKLLACCFSSVFVQWCFVRFPDVWM